MIRTKDHVEELFNDAALWDHRFYESDPEKCLSSLGIDVEAWNTFHMEDILDTYLALGKERNLKELTIKEVAATGLTHILLAFRAGYLLGKGNIEA